MAFLDDSYLLGGQTAQTLYAAVAALPVIDPHNHADVRRIADDTPFSDPWELFAATDHYVWEVMRKCGVPESHITGSASAKEKWFALAEIFPRCAGNPVYEWVHLDLKFLGFGGILLDSSTAEQLWNGCIETLARPECRPQALIRCMNIEVMCSTDDPADTLADHARANAAFGRRLIRPTWRPDRVMKIQKSDFGAYIAKLGTRWDQPIANLAALLAVLKRSHDFFAENGALASDHGIEYPYDGAASDETADAIFRAALAGRVPDRREADAFASCLMRHFAALDAEKGWVFQLHLGAVRDVRASLFQTLGPDSGGDLSDHMVDIVKPLCHFLNRFDGKLKTVLYCLDPGHQASLAGVSRAFGADVRLGSAWWLNDNPVGMRRQLEYISSVDLFSNFAGMVSDSRKLLSYSSRFEMFRRTLCGVVGEMVDSGRIPAGPALEIVREMCCSGPRKFFGLNQPQS